MSEYYLKGCLAKTPQGKISKTLKNYLHKSFGTINVELPNIEPLTKLLVKNIDAIQPILKVSSSVREKFAGAKLELIHEIESEDVSGGENITLYVSGIAKTNEIANQFAEIVDKYIDYIIDGGVLFTVQFSRNEL